MISFEEMKAMKDEAVIINAARGGVVNEEALYENLMNGKLYGANIDTISFVIVCSAEPHVHVAAL